jgi:hypothetical protein
MDKKQLPKTTNPLVVRTDFEHQQAWETIYKLIRAPVSAPGARFHAHVQFLEDVAFRELDSEQLLMRVPSDYNHPFLIVVDNTTVIHPEFPILIIDLSGHRGRSFRAIPSAIQSVENNLSISNMDFAEFADATDEDGIFRGFPQALPGV